MRTPSGASKAFIRKRGWPTTSKTFRLKRDAEDWARTTEDTMVQGVFVSRAAPSTVTLSEALDRYLREVSSTKKDSTRKKEAVIARQLNRALGQIAFERT